MSYRISPDFSRRDREGRIYLSRRDTLPLRDVLGPGLQIVMYEPFAFEVEAVAEYDAAHNAWYGRPDWSTKRNLESDALHGYWDVVFRIQRLRDEHGANTVHEAVLRKEAIALWGQLTDEERAYLESVPSVAAYGRSPKEPF